MLSENVLNGQAAPGRPPTTAAQGRPDKRLAAASGAAGISASQRCPGARRPARPSGVPSDTQPGSPRSGPALTHLRASEASVRAARGTGRPDLETNSARHSRQTVWCKTLPRGVGSAACLVPRDFVSLPRPPVFPAPDLTEALSASRRRGRHRDCLPPSGRWRGRGRREQAGWGAGRGRLTPSLTLLEVKGGK